MPDTHIDLRSPVEERRRACVAEARSAFDALLECVINRWAGWQLHRVDDELLQELLKLGRLLVAVWLAYRLPAWVPRSFKKRRGWYSYSGLGVGVVRSRFGELRECRPSYTLVHGRGMTTVSPLDRELGLAAGRMSLSVHLLVGWLAARMPFDSCTEVMRRFGGYVPSKRSMLGIVDRLGPQASEFLADLPTPPDDGEILVIQVDEKGAAMISSKEHALRCRPHQKRPKGKSKRGLRRLRREQQRPRVRRPANDKRKNARMATLAVVYTLRKLPDGTLEGPLNKRVLGTLEGQKRLFEMLHHEATKRGYGRKETLFLADGARTLWALKRQYFPDAVGCLDWYHLCEYLWEAGGVAYPQGSEDLRQWVSARKHELLTGDLDAAFEAVFLVGENRKRKVSRRPVKKCLRYMEHNWSRMPYAKLARRGLDIATGAIEGAVKHVASARLDGSGMRWSRKRAQHVLALRCVTVNRDWDAFAEAVATAHESTETLKVPRITPSHPTSPYDAVPQAA